MQNVLSKANSLIKKFFYSDLYIAIYAILIFVSWSTHQPIFGFLALAIFATLSLIFIDDVLPILPMLALSCCIAYDNSPEAIARLLNYGYALIPPALALVYHIFHYSAKFKKGKMFWPQIAIALAMLIGGCNVIPAKNYLGALPIVLLLGFLVLFVYIVFNSFYKKNEFIKPSTYFAKTMMWLGLLLTAEIAFHYIHNRIGIESWNSFWIDLGWGIDNSVALFLLLTTPLTFYLSTITSKDSTRYKWRTKKLGWIYVILGYIQYATMCFTFSRGGILFSIITAPLVIIFTIIKSENKKNIIIPTLICIAGALIVYFAMFDKFNDMFYRAIHTSSGAGWAKRDFLYKEAVQAFVTNPIFGGGCGFAGNYYECEINAVTFYWFHSTVFQIIGSMGVIGIIAFLYYYVKRYAIIFKNIRVNTFSLFAFLALFAFELYSLLDRGIFVPFPYMCLVMLLTLYVERENEEWNVSAPDGYQLEKYTRKLYKK